MSEYAAVFALIGTVSVVITGVFSTILANLVKRIGYLEIKVSILNNYTITLWEWGRNLVDMYYVNKIDSAPSPPPMPKFPDFKE